MVTFGGMRTPTNEYFNFLFINSPLHTRSRMLDMEPCPYSGNPMYIYRVERQTPRGLYAEKQHHEVDGSLSPDELLPQTTQSPRFSYSSSHIAQTDGSRTPSSSSSDKSSASTAPSVASSLRPLEGTLAPLGDHPIVQPQPVSSQTDHYNFLTGVEYLPEGDNHADGSASVVLSHPAFEPHSMAAYVPLSSKALGAGGKIAPARLSSGARETSSVT
ncbi:hypothetical protein BJX64DRAFT_285231 [Aspergillus heterothallicus]